MEDKTIEVSRTVFRCLLHKFNDCADRGELVTPARDAADLLSAKGGYESEIERLIKRISYAFSKSAPTPNRRYRLTLFTDKMSVLAFWHQDDAGEWLFVPDDDDRFMWCRSQSGELAWKVPESAARGEFRSFAEVWAGICEADSLANAEMRSD